MRLILLGTLPVMACLAAPVLVQHNAGSLQQNSMSSASNIVFRLPEPSQAGNCIIVALTRASGTTLTISDDQSNTWNVGHSQTDSGAGQIAEIQYVMNSTANTRKITLHFSSPTTWIAWRVSEFSGIALTSALDVHTGSSASSGTVTAGSVTPSQSGDLVYHYVFRDGTIAVSSWTKGSGFSLLDGDHFDGSATQYQVYNSASALNPTLTMASSTGYVTAAIFLKAASAGSPSNLSFRVNKIIHQKLLNPSGGAGGPSGQFTVQLPTVGSTFIAAWISGGNTVSSITDNQGNTWTNLTTPSSNDSVCQILYVKNAVASNDLLLTVDLSAYNTDAAILFYDITGADLTSPIDNFSVNTGTAATTADFTSLSLTPAAVGELMLSLVGVAFNTLSDCVSVGCLFDAGYEDSTGTLSPPDDQNGWAHLRSTDTSAYSFTWHQFFGSPNADRWAAMAVALKSAPASSTPSVSRTGKVTRSGK